MKKIFFISAIIFFIILSYYNLLDVIIFINNIIVNFYMFAAVISELSLGIIPFILSMYISSFLCLFFPYKTRSALIIFSLINIVISSMVFVTFTDCEEMGEGICLGKKIFWVSSLLGTFIYYCYYKIKNR